MSLVLIKLKADALREDILKFKQKLMENPNVFEAYEIAEDYDILAGFFGEGVNSLHNVIEDAVRGEKVINDYKILLVLKH